MGDVKKEGYKPKIRMMNRENLVRKYSQDKIAIRKQKGCNCGNNKQSFR